MHFVARVQAVILNRLDKAQIESTEGRNEKRKSVAWKEVRGQEDYSMMSSIG